MPQRIQYDDSRQHEARNCKLGPHAVILWQGGTAMDPSLAQDDAKTLTKLGPGYETQKGDASRMKSQQ